MDVHCSLDKAIEIDSSDSMRNASTTITSCFQCDDADEKFSKSRVIIISIMASFSGINFGYCLGYTGYYMNIISDIKIFYDGEKAIYSSIILLGAATGSVLFGFFILNKMGRRYSLIISSLISLCGWSVYFLIVKAEVRSKINAPILLYLSRFLNGIGIGGATIASSVYVAEISPSKIYSITSTFHQIGIGFGFFIVYTIQFVVSQIDTKEHYYGLLVLPLFIFLIQILQAIFACIIPHSVSWMSLSWKNKKNAAKLITDNTRRLYGSDYGLERNLRRIANNLVEVPGSSRGIMKFLRSKGTVKAMFIGITLMFFQQFNGINPVCFNALNIISSAGLDNDSIGSLIIGISHIIGAILSIPATRKLGTKKNLVLSSIVMALAHLLIGIYFTFWVSEKIYAYFTVFLLISYFIFFNISWGPIPYIINSCIYKPEIVNVASGIANMLSWLFSFIISYSYYSLAKAFGIDGVFYLFFGFSLLATIFSVLFIPETGNKSSSELASIYDDKLLHVKF